MDLFKTPAAPQTGLVPIGPQSAAPTQSFRTMAFRIVGILVAVVIVYYLFKYISGRSSGGSTAAASDDLLSSSADGKKRTNVAAGNFPTGDGSDYGIQFWMYISDWGHQFGFEKNILFRGRSTLKNPSISLHPTDNSLNVSVRVYPSGGSTVRTTGMTGDVFTCTVENVPLQSWFAVSMTVFQRNLDIYINGQLVKSCVLPGVPMLPSGAAQVGDNRRGFAGSMCTLKYTPRALTPSDATAFYNAGTPCSQTGAPSAETPEGPGFTLFGYTFRFAVFKGGKRLKSYTVG
jgi:hypothetical protein